MPQLPLMYAPDGRCTDPRLPIYNEARAVWRMKPYATVTDPITGTERTVINPALVALEDQAKALTQALLADASANA